MLFRNTDLLNDFERLTKGLNLGPEFDRTVDDLSTKFTSTFAGAPNLDVVRSDDRFALFIDLPGVDPKSVDVIVDGRTLTVSATREFEIAEGHEHVHAGRRHGAFNRSFKLADDLDVDGMSARSEHGVLIVTIPVIAAPQPRKIQVDVDVNNDVVND
ncbi:MAG: Hsp20/alpha crystallin family protein [Acidimicrobiaceae bacterium]|nr:Hsp20/alpha crystallin family protein [Acidimicrobiaceae bacterium]